MTLTARPEHMSVSTTHSPGSLPGVVDAVLPVGPSLIYEIVLKDGTPVKVSQARAEGQQRAAARYGSLRRTAPGTMPGIRRRQARTSIPRRDSTSRNPNNVTNRSPI